MSKCERYETLISAMLDGELTPEERSELQAHLAECPDCAAMYAAFAEVSEALKAETEAEPLPAALHENIMARVRVAEKAKKTHGTIMRLRPILAAAACVVVLAGTVLALRNHGIRMNKGADSPAAPELYTAGSVAASPTPEENVSAGSAQEIAFAKTADSASPESSEAEVPAAAEGSGSRAESPAVGSASSGSDLDGAGETGYSYASTGSDLAAKEAQGTDTATQREPGEAVITIRITAQEETGMVIGVVTDAGDQSLYAAGDSVTVLIPAHGTYAPGAILKVTFSAASQRQDGAIQALEIARQ